MSDQFCVGGLYVPDCGNDFLHGQQESGDVLLTVLADEVLSQGHGLLLHPHFKY